MENKPERSGWELFGITVAVIVGLPIIVFIGLPLLIVYLVVYFGCR